MKRHWKYLKYVMRHKWWVAYYGWKLKLPLWILIFHDWDKFHPDEWFPYANFFYGDLPTKEEARTAFLVGATPYTKEDCKRDFNKAWLYHQNRNKHHWQYWILTNDDDGKPVCLPMPDKYRREMLADWRGAGHAINGFDDTQNWYKKNYHNIQLHSETRHWVNLQLEVMEKDNEVIYVT